MRTGSGVSYDLFRAVDGYTRAITALASMPARWANDFASAFDNAACRPRSNPCCDPCPPRHDHCCDNPCGDHSDCCDPCPPACDPCAHSCADPCDPCATSCAPACDPCHTSGCGCGKPSCSRCGGVSRRLAVGALVQLRSGIVGEVTSVEDGFVKLDSEGARRFAKSAICKVLKTELKVDERIRTTSGIVGTITDVSDPHVVTISSGGTNLEIDRKVICEVLPEPPAHVIK